MGTHSAAEIVRRRRRELGISSQQQLASAAGLATGTISLVERASLISRRTAEKLAPVLRVSAEELLDNAADPTGPRAA